jgi:hypothetical protein
MYGDEVSYMVADRLEVRLDPERRRKLARIAAARGAPISAVVRELIDQAYQAVDRAERLHAARELAQFEIEDVPDPETLNRQLDSTHASPDLH